ncbi:winged helix-turn-helix domain-containing protein [Crocosphaera sp. XPORK-15E]|uniref:winged helix-turn-helix domain-containing protein n=1 Tax=Crocosphaera sp. XPORK-15E TaxID=3110247 RepID=UPI002B1FB3A4|nr:winged helix-turn-helix domain-containing protein [Crocosphaera sp. XPORK-15E]MEA5535840.1 winged helix-turn-helix domain-containing protein [Crocosphaera sp. XPORK-15E]
MPFTIIATKPGPTTSDRILELILTHPQGITVKGLSDRLNRPVSMIQHCLKDLTSLKIVQAELNSEDRQWVYSPTGKLTEN